MPKTTRSRAQAAASGQTDAPTPATARKTAPRRATATTLSPLSPAVPGLTFFIAGIIQGSLAGARIHGQTYRGEVAALLARRYAGATVYDPFAHHPNSVGYDFDHGRDVFFDLMDRAGRADVVVAFVPEASMGTAIELWNAFHAGAVVVVVSPLTENWVVKFLADQVLPDLAALRSWVEEGGLDRLIEGKIVYRTRTRRTADAASEAGKSTKGERK